MQQSAQTQSRRSSRGPRRGQQRQEQRARSPSVTFADEEEDGTTTVSAPLNILPALPAMAVYHHRFPPLPGETATESDRKTYISRRRAEMK
eukprot:7127648-Pyramimonas_sp.AAC.1